MIKKKHERGPDKFCIYRKKIFVLKCKLLKNKRDLNWLLALEHPF